MDLKVIKEIRKSKKVKLNDLSKKTGLRVDRLSRIEKGEVDPSINTVELILNELGFKLSISIVCYE